MPSAKVGPQMRQSNAPASIRLARTGNACLLYVSLCRSHKGITMVEYEGLYFFMRFYHSALFDP